MRSFDGGGDGEHNSDSLEAISNVEPQSRQIYLLCDRAAMQGDTFSL